MYIALTFFCALGFSLLHFFSKHMKFAGKVPRSKFLSLAEVSGVFWVHMGLFFVYNTIIGYLLLNQQFEQVSSLIFYFLALAVHFIANDWSLRRHHEKVYDQYGRLLLSFASLFGWLLALFVEIGEFGVSVLFAFVSGGMILNIMKEELPEEQKSSISSFVVGSIVFTVLLLLI